jgi:PTH2 family peptidyl-tRNA hydrolase
MSKVVTCMRSDLNMRKGKMIAQGQHGIQYMILDNLFVEADPTKSPRTPGVIFQEWLHGDHTKITCKVTSLAQVYAIAKAAAAAGIPGYIVEDLGKTDVPALSVTCLVLGPAAEEDLDKITGSLELL